MNAPRHRKIRLSLNPATETPVDLPVLDAEQPDFLKPDFDAASVVVSDAGMRAATTPTLEPTPTEVATVCKDVTFDTWLKSDEGRQMTDPRLPFSSQARVEHILIERLRVAWDRGAGV